MRIERVFLVLLMLELLESNPTDRNFRVAAVRAILRMQDVDETVLVVGECVLDIPVVESHIITVLLAIAGGGKDDGIGDVHSR